MNHISTGLHARDFSPERDIEGENMLERFRLICKISHINEHIMEEVDMLQHEHQRTGFFSEKTWLKFLELLQMVVDIRKQSNVLGMDSHRENATSKKLVGSRFINDSLFEFKVSIIRGVLESLKREVGVLQSGPLTIDTSDDILEIENTLSYFTKLLANPRSSIDWQTLRSFMDDAEERMKNARMVSEKLTTKLNTILKNNTPTQKTSSDGYESFTARGIPELDRETAWGALLESTVDGKNITNQELDRIKMNLHPDFSYDHLTNTIITTVKNNQLSTSGIEALPMERVEYKKAAAKVLQSQGNTATRLSLQLRDDLHKIYGTKAANDELMYNTLAETFSDMEQGTSIEMSVAGFDEFQIIMHERNKNNPELHTLRVAATRYGSSEREILTIICRPEQVRAGSQARVAIQIPQGSGKGEYISKIELLDVNSICDMRKSSGVSSENDSGQPSSLWNRAKTSVTKTWNNWFSKKAA